MMVINQTITKHGEDVMLAWHSGHAEGVEDQGEPDVLKGRVEVLFFRAAAVNIKCFYILAIVQLFPAWSFTLSL